MRIRGAETELQEAGLDADNMASSTAKLRAEILALSKVDIMKDENTFKSTYDILDELSKKWKDLTDIQQASITELIAGKRQGNIMSSLMNNFDIARKALETSRSSSGSAETELDKYMQSIEAKQKQLTASLQAFSQATLNTDFVKGAIDGLRTLTEWATKAIDAVGLLPGILGGVGIAAFIKNFDQPKGCDVNPEDIGLPRGKKYHNGDTIIPWEESFKIRKGVIA